MVRKTKHDTKPLRDPVNVISCRTV